MLKSFDLKTLLFSRRNVLLHLRKHLIPHTMFKIYVTNMRTGHVVEFKYKDKKTARNRFISSCNRLNYKYTDISELGLSVAGGVDHEFRIELVEVK